MASRQKTPKTFQQRQTERQLQDEKAKRDREEVEDMAAKFSCSNGVARDFAGQCEERLGGLEFDLACSKLALSFWSSPPAAEQPVVAVLHELAVERQRHADMLTQLRGRLLELTTPDTVHHHLDLPAEHYQQEVRRLLLIENPPVQNHAASGDR